MTDIPAVAVFGASGHTGRFVVEELGARGLRPIPITRATADVDRPADLDRAVAGAAAVVNCAGPFAGTAFPVIDAAIRAGIPYLDVSAEIEQIADVLDRYRDAPILVVPSVAFFGGLADLLATAAAGDWTELDSVTVAYGLSSWNPTAGTLRTGAVSAGRRDAGSRPVFTGGRLRYRTGSRPESEWDFPAPLGRQPVIAEFTMAESSTIPAHLATGEIRTSMTTAAVTGLRAAGPREDGEAFVVDVVVQRGGETRRAVASGRDIYAISAPLVVEATLLALRGIAPAGAKPVGAVFDAADLLRSIGPRLEVVLPPSGGAVQNPSDVILTDVEALG